LLSDQGMANPTSKTPPGPGKTETPRSRVVRPDSEKYTGQAPPEDIDGGPSAEDVDFGAEVSPEERKRREDELARTDEGF
jgi:hypothetical protein